MVESQCLRQRRRPVEAPAASEGPPTDMTAAQHMQVRMQGVSCSTTNPVPAMVPLNCERSRNYAANNLANPHGL